MNQTLEQFIKSKVTAELFEKLADKLSITPTKLTRIFNRPKEASKDEVLNLAALIRISPVFLISEFKMGHHNITLDDFSHIHETADL